MTPLALFAQARVLLAAEVATGRRCRVCGAPTGKGRRVYCGAEACLDEAKLRCKKRREWEQRKQQLSQ